MKCLLYARVSTLDKGQNPEVQIDELRRFCLARSWMVVEEIIDHGFSGGNDLRPGLKRVMTLARTRKVDIVVVTKLDRLARSLRHLVSVLDDFQTLGILFVSTNDHIDLTTASGRLMLHIVGAFAEFERSLIRERTIAGLIYARSKGKKLGRPKLRDDSAILRFREEGFSYSQIEKKLNVSRPAIGRAIREAGTKSLLRSMEKSHENQGTRDE